MCDAYDGPQRPTANEYKLSLPTILSAPKKCGKCGKTKPRSVANQSLYVNGKTVAVMTPVTAAGGIIVPPKKYLGDHIANGLAKLGAKQCPTCIQRKEWVNGVDRGMRKLIGRG